MQPISRSALLALAMGAAVFATALLSQIHPFNGSIPTVWLANACAVPALLACARSRWPGMLVIMASALFTAELVIGASVVEGAFVAALNTSQVWLVAAMLLRRFDGPVTLDSIRAVGEFSLTAGVVGPLFSGVPIGIYLGLLSNTPVVAAVVHSYLGQSLGTLALTPLLLSLSGRRADVRTHGRLEPTLLLLISIGVAVLVFSRRGSLLFVLLPVLLLSAFRLRAGATALIFVSISMVAIVATSMGVGPIADGGLGWGTDILILQAFIASAMSIMLPINAVIAERERLSAALVDTERDLRKAAEAAAAAKSHFVATMSHEIRTPMTGVLGMTSCSATIRRTMSENIIWQRSSIPPTC